MKIAISYPPLKSKKGIACLGQNRQFQWFNTPTYIYPVIPAYAATLLKNKGYDVMWDEGIAEGLTYAAWQKRIVAEAPDLIAFETKTPVIKMHWQVIAKLKLELPKTKIVLMGDHVTAFPEESMQNSLADFVIASGDYDFMLLNLANHLKNGEVLEGGFWCRNGEGKISNTGPADLSKHDLNTLPIIDRELTKWKLYAYKNGNFKYTPGAYMMSGRDCWWGRCTFCAWTILFPGKNFRTMSAKKALDEVENLIKLGAKEIMEDSGSLPIGPWLEEFCTGMIERGYNKKITMSCNMRITGIRDPKIWALMKKAGFRFVLFGLESANQETLDRIDKNLKVEEIEPGLKLCKEAGLEPHITAMIGYPWETKEMAERTIALAKKLFKDGHVDTLQGTIVIPYPGTPLHKYCLENNLLLTQDYAHYDQREMVMKSQIDSKEAKDLVQGLYKSFASPQFIWRKLISIRNFADIKFLFVTGWKWLGKMIDFSKSKKESC
ncbi:MAG: radical SAM protein [Candidatus Moraniibacteriota bacterium]